MNTQEIQKNNSRSNVEKVIELLEKIERVAELEKISQSKPEFPIPESTPTQGTVEVRLPLSYRQLPRIQ